MPCLLFIYDVQTATPLIAGIATIAALIIAFRLQRKINIKTMWRLFISGISGIPLGLVILKWVHNDVLVIFLGIIIIASSLFQLIVIKKVELASDRLSYVFGFIAGVLGVSYNIPAPPLVIYATLRRWDRETFIGTLQGLFLIWGVIINIAHVSIGLWTLPLLKLLLLCIPAAIIGIASGFLISRFIKKKKFNAYVHLILITLGGILIIKSMV